MQYISIIKDDLELSAQPHRYLRLPHPRTGSPQLYLPYYTEGRDCILEAVKIQCSSRRTWFIGESQIEAGTILIHHPVDPLFVVIPIVSALLGRPTMGSSSTVPFQPLFDLIANAASLSAFALPEAFSTASTEKSARTSSEGVNEDMARLLALKSVRKAFRLCCERKVVPLAPPSPPESGSSSSALPTKQVYYRPSLARVIALLQTKVDYFSAVEQFEQFDHLVRGMTRDGLLGAGSDSSSGLTEAARRKMTCEHLGQWLAPPILAALIASYDFVELSAYQANRTAAHLAAQAPVVPAKKEDKAAAKRKTPAGSRGVEALKKVNTTSMNKLTSFFRPKEAKK